MVEKTIDHKIENNKLKFLTLWEGHPPEEATWEEAHQFLPAYNKEFLKYCKNNKLRLDLVDQLGKNINDK